MRVVKKTFIAVYFSVNRPMTKKHNLRATVVSWTGRESCNFPV